MKLSQEENGKSNNILQKIKYSINKNNSQPERLYSSYKKRPLTTTKMKKSWKINKLSNSNKTTFDFPYLGYNLHTSKYFSNKIYLNKNNFIWGKNKMKNNHFYEKEELFEKIMNLQNKVNSLNNKNNKQKIEINKQKKEIKKQNKILNEVNNKFFFDKLLNNEEQEEKKVTQEDLNKENNQNGQLSKRRSYSTEQINDKNFNNISNKLLDNINNNNLKDLYKKLLKQNEIKEQEILRLKEKIESIKFSNETLISNMKLKYKDLQIENNKKTQEFNELKKSSKCTKYNEIMKEKEVYERELLKIKNKFYHVLRQLEKYKNCYEENKMLVEEINKKNTKIKKLENEIILFSKNSENSLEILKKEINKKDKKIQKLENDIKKYICLYNNIQKEDDKKINFYQRGFKLLFKNKSYNDNSHNINFNNINLNQNEISYNKKNELNEQKQNEDIINENYNINNKNKEIYVNHCLNFSNKNSNNIISQSPSSYSSRANLFSASLKNINMRNEKIKKLENSILKNSRILEIIKLYPELYQLFIEMKKRNINDNKTFINEVLMKLKEDIPNNENEKNYCESIIKLFNIEDENSKKIIENLSHKEFEDNKSLQEIKIHHIKLFNELFNQKRENKSKEILNEKLGEINMDEFNKLIIKYDSCESGYVFFDQMISIIKELKLENFIEDILLLTKESDIFDLMNYNNILNIINEKNMNKHENNENSQNNDNNKDNEISQKNVNIQNIENSKDNENTQNNENIQNIENSKDNENSKNNDENSQNNEKNESIINEQNENIEKKENTQNNNNSISKYIEKKFKNTEEKDNNNSIEKILKSFAHIILIEGSTPSVYINSLKETLELEENKTIEVINPEKFFNFLENKNLTLTEEEKEQIIKEYGTIIEEEGSYINYDKIVEKIFYYMKNDEGNSNDEDFMKNIKSMDIEGMD